MMGTIFMTASILTLFCGYSDILLTFRHYYLTFFSALIFLSFLVDIVVLITLHSQDRSKELLPLQYRILSKHCLFLFLFLFLSFSYSFPFSFLFLLFLLTWITEQLSTSDRYTRGINPPPSAPLSPDPSISIFLNRLVQQELSLQTFIGFLSSGARTCHWNWTLIPSMCVQNGTYRRQETLKKGWKTTGMAYPIIYANVRNGSLRRQHGLKLWICVIDSTKCRVWSWCSHLSSSRVRGRNFNTWRLVVKKQVRALFNMR